MRNLFYLISVCSVLSVLSCSSTCPAVEKAALLKPHKLLEKKFKSPALEKKIKTTDRELLRDAVREVRKEQGITDKADKSLGKAASVDNMAAWEAINPAPLVHIPWTLPAIKGIAEVRTPQSESEISNLKSELAYFRTLGYNTALAVWRGESPVALSAIIRDLRNDGWRIILTFGPAEVDTATPYLDPDSFRQAFALLLPDCDALLITWRKTSPGHWQGGAGTLNAWCAKVADIARRVKPNLPILGEFYFRPSDRTVIGWAPVNISAVLISNAGYNGLVPSGIANLARGKTDKPLIALILGPAPYYNTAYPQYSQPPAEIRTTCSRLEARYCREGFAGTITLAGDGWNGWHNGHYYSDSLTETNWSKQGK